MPTIVPISSRAEVTPAQVARHGGPQPWVLLEWDDGSYRKITARNLGFADRMNQPQYFAEDYGVSTGNSASVNTTNLTALFTTVAAETSDQGAEIILPRGSVLLNAIGAFLCNAMSLVGAGVFPGTALFFQNTTGNNLALHTFAHCRIANLAIHTSVRKTGGFAIDISNGAFMPVVENVRLDYQVNGIFLGHCSTARIENVTFRYMLGSLGIQTLALSAAAPCTRPLLHNLNADNPYPVDANGALFTWAATTPVTLGAITVANGRIYQCSDDGTTGASAPTGIPGTAAADAFTAEITDGSAKWKFVCDANLSWIWIDQNTHSTVINEAALIGGARCLVVNDNDLGVGNKWPTLSTFIDVEGDHSYLGSVLLNYGLSAKFSDCWFGSSRTGAGIEIAGTFGGTVVITRTELAGNWTMGLNVAADTSVRDLSVDDCDIGMNSQFTANFYPGIYIGAGNKGFQIVKNRSGAIAVIAAYGIANHQSYGCVIDTGASDDYVIALNRWIDNDSGGLFDGGSGTNKYIPSGGNITT